MKRGLFGGSFDPVHLGHLRCAEEIRELFGLDQILFIPAARQPLKTEQQPVGFHHRAVMARLAVEGNPAFVVSERENRRDGPSYSIDTVNEFLREQSPGDRLYFIMGRDAFMDITRWKDWRNLMNRCDIVVMTRPGTGAADAGDSPPPEIASEYSYDDEEQCFRGERGGNLYFRRLTLLDISATDIRNRLAVGRSIRYLVPETVAAYIKANGLYAASRRR
jgi:nicotinate-nucleotide adenylyltransferase